MDIRPSTSQGAAIIPGDQNEIADQKSVPQEGSASSGDAQVPSNSVQAMKQAGTETKASMKTSEIFIQQQLAGQLRNVPQFAAGTATVAKSPDPAMEKARKEGQMWMDHGNKMLKEHRYSEALEAFEEGFRTYLTPVSSSTKLRPY